MEKKMVILGSARGEITEKKSRFIASVFEIHSEEEAAGFLDAVRKQYYDARHHCYAYVLGERGETQRFSDDKEPQGTAGKPILEVIRGQGFSNTLIVVTRYFGGILLGTGGLARAYTASAQEGLRSAEQNGQCAGVCTGRSVQIVCDYNLSGKVQYLISQMEIPVAEVLYGADVTWKLMVPEELLASFTKKITEATNAGAKLTAGEQGSFLISDGRPVDWKW